MNPLEKHLLVLEPLLEELAPLGYFRKGRQLWRIDRQQGYAIMLETEMYMHGTYKNICVHYGSFWKDCTASKQQGISLGSMITLDDRCLPFDTICFETDDQLEQIVRASAPYMVHQVKQHVLPILRTIHDLPSFVKASEAILQRPGTWPAPHRVWDYLALGQRETAYSYLRGLLRYSWRDALEKSLVALPPQQQATARQWNEQRAALMDRNEQHFRARIQSVLDELEAMQDDVLTVMLQARFSRFETALAAYIGPQRWKQL